MAYTTIDNPELYFQTKLYTGTGSEIAATLDGSENMQPDLVAIKARTDTESHKVYDSVRGVTKHIEWDTTDAEATEAQGLKSFDSDGFTIGTYSSINASSSHTYVAWCWKESATSGFDIVAFTGNATARTISHSLSAVPHVIIVKPRESGSEGWSMYHKGIASDAETDNIRLDEANAAFDNAGYWNDTAPTSSVFTVGSDSATNTNTEGVIAYLFAPKQGFSKFGEYDGNGNADGTFVYTGFKPALVIYKKYDAHGQGWVMNDNKRDPFNVADAVFYANTNEAESDYDSVDFLANGFKHRSTGGSHNASGSEYVYLAFAEAPFVNSNGVPCNAR